jgi:hypothetical protein
VLATVVSLLVWRGVAAGGPQLTSTVRCTRSYVSDRPENLVRVAVVPTDVEASVIICALESHGIRSISEGALTSAMRAETPGVVRILVCESQASEARDILRTLRNQPSSEA